MNNADDTLISIGALLLVGLLLRGLGQRTVFPRVTWLLVLGVVIGPVAFDVLPDNRDEWFPIVTEIALAMIGFLLGGEFTPSKLRGLGRAVLGISIGVTAVTAVLVVVGTLAAGASLETALILGGIAPATAPAATVAVIHELRARGRFSRALQAIVALDDVWGLLLFSILLAVSAASLGQEAAGGGVLDGIREIVGSVGLGAALGLPMAFLTGRLRPGEPTLLAALGLVFLAAGLARELEVSLLLTALTMGTVVANLAAHHARPFQAIKRIEWPFLVLFFVLAGASLEPGALQEVGWVGLAYVGFRVLGRFGGVWVGAIAARTNGSLRRWMPLALMPHAGVALGMALVARERLPVLEDEVLPVVVVSTVVFELVGPVLQRFALGRVRELHPDRKSGRL